jgi:hypothetical protein
MRKVECKKSKHHGFYEEDGACPMCAPEKAEELTHGQDGGAATREGILRDLDQNLLRRLDQEMHARAPGLYSSPEVVIQIIGAWAQLYVTAPDGKRLGCAVPFPMEPFSFSVGVQRLASECWRRK